VKQGGSLVERIHTDAQSMGLSLAQGSAQTLSEYTDLLATRAIPLGLVARSDEDRIYHRHVLDSLRVASLVSSDDRMAYDLGSGAGLPGVVVAVVAPWCRVVLVEPRRIRVGFLEMVLERLGLPNAEISSVRAERLENHADLVMARAFAPLPRTWKIAGTLLRPGGRLIYFAGESLVNAMETARAAVRGSLPATLTSTRVLATFSPLVIMTRT
jgi:16S rRNA (guanine527-N7)-methyltransferase